MMTGQAAEHKVQAEILGSENYEQAENQGMRRKWARSSRKKEMCHKALRPRDGTPCRLFYSSYDGYLSAWCTWILSAPAFLFLAQFSSHSTH